MLLCMGSCPGVLIEAQLIAPYKSHYEITLLDFFFPAELNCTHSKLSHAVSVCNSEARVKIIMTQYFVSTSTFIVDIDECLTPLHKCSKHAVCKTFMDLTVANAKMVFLGMYTIVKVRKTENFSVVFLLWV